MDDEIGFYQRRCQVMQEPALLTVEIDMPHPLILAEIKLFVIMIDLWTNLQGMSLREKRIHITNKWCGFFCIVKKSVPNTPNHDKPLTPTKNYNSLLSETCH